MNVCYLTSLAVGLRRLENNKMKSKSTLSRAAIGRWLHDNPQFVELFPFPDGTKNKTAENQLKSGKNNRRKAPLLYGGPKIRVKESTEKNERNTKLKFNVRKRERNFQYRICSTTTTSRRTLSWSPHKFPITQNFSFFLAPLSTQPECSHVVVGISWAMS